ncbi:PREDICTED: uncharacterized protein LOC109174961 [Ipomoea nil]|uniref:uncharacterized protein LOC109174961 n=1 Tax=Ipomoea nil TaxID=35883 RepID=UPI000901B0AE|nr:PREDICTED: uncharacterized protein LOC109174961 [Ipomoea nil]XP_019179749.1 PREDICTED: uncharacterized protein LOC109174961 [Ipomoea nil]XP_019179751.1 PREDICTED: uncharacterized protein LOC109174961 [Ipomoea nil]XP_019179752.1 PREDICTED: uncharacterized protein LOC109174961 [Ipomoea nil]XP_019179753.1 PREDICTED: uncharacterized protein LOC109174961 [Ipomoea nil]XP_019179754.1 PREDICTED: uncharacterized protein LOC109174961 [Ipomoea nil]XP_019179755.1 PREDICTED: uncharacterized protein LOC
MDSIQMNSNTDCTEHMATGKSLPSDSSDACGVFGEPHIRPRVGEEYQVEIPPYPENKAEGTDSWDLFVGLHIPLRWANEGGDTTKKLGDSSQIASSSRGSESSSDIIVEDGKLRNASIEEEQPKGGCPESCLVPDDVLDSWTDIERKSFLLALYIFDKNFVHVKRFVQTKKTSDIMAYYYGEFYGSDEFRRWSDGRRVRSRKCVYGQKIFVGSRLQELLSRLFPKVSAEGQSELLEISRTFGEGKMLLEEYVFTLKRLVGINALIEAVGIGEVKDLTSMAFEPTRSNNVLTMRSEIPTGKACSSLTPNEIIKYLTGGYRLSKARSNDLFWEAVWPLLLARGWHSEQPKNMPYGAGSSKHSLVFLMPGVKKFSRKLVKGNHYFDSVTDVLGKVASEPKLLDLDTEEDRHEENEGHHGAKVESDDLPPVRSHSYLQPRTPNECTDDIKFTVVDTSLCDGKPYKVRDLKSLSLGTSRKLSTQTHSEDSGKDSQKVSTDIPDSVDTMLLDQAVLISADSNTSLPNGETSSGRKDLEVGATNRKMANVINEEVHGSCPESIPVTNAMKNVDLCEDMKSKKVVKPRISQKLREEDDIVPITKKRRRLTACSRTETNNISCVSRVELAMPSCCSSVHNMPATNALQTGSFQDKMSSTSSSKSSPSVSTECVPVNNSCPAEISPVEPQPRILIDLNVLPVSPDSENGLSLTETTEEQTDGVKKPESDSELQVVTGVDSSDQQQPPSMSSRRHGTRNRPPTMRALEALANGFLTVNRRQKNREAGPGQNLGSKSSEQAHGKTKAAEFGNNSEVSKLGEGTYNAFSKFQPPPDGNGGTTSGP